MVDMIRAVSEEAARVNPKAIRVVNSGSCWGEDAANNLGSTPRIVSPYEMWDMLIKAGVGYEAVGMQPYFGYRDLYEIDELLERYSKLGKRIHVCEQDTFSKNIGQPDSCFPDGHAGQTWYRWHRPWDEALQAEWLEGMFIVCLSKDYVDEWDWWDTTDFKGIYMPWAGLLDKDFYPKPAYRRLEDLVDRWGGRLKGLGKR